MSGEPERCADWQARFLGEIPAAVALFDGELRYVAASAAWAAAFGLSPGSVAGYRHGELSKAGSEALEEAQRRALAGKSVEQYGALQDDPPQQSWRPIFSARPHHDVSGAIVGVIVALRQDHPFTGADLLASLADPLTGLAERREFASRIRQALAQPARPGDSVSLFALNINRFRNINNLHGTRIGDLVLRITAERLLAGTRSVRPVDEETGRESRARDMVARLGADEFGIICGPPALSPAHAEAFADRILRIVQNPIAIGDLSLRLTASVGYMTTTTEHADENDALRDLDLALQRAKALGAGKASAWEPSLTRAATRRYSLTDQLRRAFDDGEFLLYYQPVVRLSDSRMIGAEALLRWRHPSEGVVAPGAFLHVLEETGLIVEVGCWVIREAARQLESWQVLFGRDIVDWVSVNVSPRQFDDPSPLLSTLSDLHAGGFAVRRLKLEITETTFMRNPEITQSVLGEIGRLGIRVGIDDFGTGYSSLSMLRRYPVDTIKIDGEFIAQIGTTKGDELAQALLSIAQMYGTAIIAEGIETAAQRDFLRARGCGFGQGYLFGEPMEGALLGSRALTNAGGRSRVARRAG